MNYKKGFTTAEVVITLGIIGALAVILLPVLIQDRPNQEMIMFKKAYTQLSRAVNELINDDDFYPETELTSNIETNSGFGNNVEVVYHGKKFGGTDNDAKTKFCKLVAVKLNIRGEEKCDVDAQTLANGGHFITSDGIVWLMPINDFHGSEQEVTIDVNGSDGYNCFEGQSCKEPDRFTIKVSRQGLITLPNNGIELKYLNSENNTKKYKDY